MFLAYNHFARKHSDLFAIMFQSGTDKSAYPKVAISAAKAFGVAGELAPQLRAQRQRPMSYPSQFATMAPVFATLAWEAALSRVGEDETESTAKNLVLRLLSGFRAQQV